jgi:hypothetical protein
MAATHQFSESNLVGEVVQDGITNLNLGSIDDHELNTTTYPITRGNASFEKYIRAKFSSTFTEISNMKFWRSDVLGYKTGETLKAAANVSFATPSATANADSDIPLTEGAPALAIQSAAGTSTITAPGYTKYIRLQLQTSGSTPSGAMFQKTLLFQYDEI